MENRPDGTSVPVRTLYDTIMQKIMFNDKYGLTQAVLEGRKTMTRRVVSENLLQQAEAYRHEFYNYTLDALPLEDALLELSPFKIGDVVAVAQSYMKAGYDRNMIQRATFRTNAYDGKQIGDFKICLLPGWKNKMYVLPSMMPHQIRITNVRVEKLQDISDEDCVREGILEDCPNVQYSFPTEIGYCGQYPFNTPREAFAALIDKISGKGTWEMNPFVFVYEFKRIR